MVISQVNWHRIIHVIRRRGRARGQPVTSSSSMTACTPLAIEVAPTTASCSAAVRTWPVSVSVFPAVAALTSLSSGTRADRASALWTRSVMPAGSARSGSGCRGPRQRGDGRFGSRAVAAETHHAGQGGGAVAGARLHTRGTMALRASAWFAAVVSTGSSRSSPAAALPPGRRHRGRHRDLLGRRPGRRDRCGAGRTGPERADSRRQRRGGRHKRKRRHADGARTFPAMALGVPLIFVARRTASSDFFHRKTIAYRSHDPPPDR